MAVSLKHTTQASGTDAGNGEIGKTQWNEEHTLTLGTGKLLGRTTAGAGAAEEISAGTGLTLSGGSLSVTTNTYQPLDADLTAIAGLAGTSGLLKKTAADTWSLDTTNYANATAAVSAIGYSINGGGSVLTTGLAGNGLFIPFDCTINSVTLLADVSGSAVVDIYKNTYASWPFTTGSICASAKPTITASTKSQDTTLTGWTKTVSAGDILRFNVDSASTITELTIILKVTKT